MNATLAKKTITNAVKKGIRFTKRNSNVILTMLAVIGVTVTAEELVRATVKAVKVCEEKQIKDKKEIVKTVWKIYIPSAGFFLITTAAIIGNAHINAKRLATVTGLCALERAELSDLRKKVAEVVGPKKEKSIEDEIAKDRIDATPIPDEGDIIHTGHGNQLYLDFLSGRYIRTSEDHIKLVEEILNRKMGESWDQQVPVKVYFDEMFRDAPAKNGPADCLVADLYWDYGDMNLHGEKKIELRTMYHERKIVNGELEMVAAIKPDPFPIGL